MKFNPFKHFGPGTLIAAAFIGPGTVTICTKSGVGFGFALLWALVLSIIATVVLQEMAARLGIVTKKGLAEAVKDQLKIKWVKYLAVVLMISAILIGNSAYQSGNISGGVLGLQTIFPSTNIQIGDFKLNYLVLILSLIASVILYVGSYKVIERILVSLVVLMSLSFIITAILTRPDLGMLFKGAFVPSMPEGSLLMVIGLIGTTVVPYNLFLHASLVKEKWKGEEDLPKVRKDTLISIVLGGLVSMSIVIAAASIQASEVSNASDLAKGLEPLYGEAAKYFLGIGLFAAGITSAVTAPMAAAYVAKGCFGWNGDLKSKKLRVVWILVLLIGTVVSIVGKSPVAIIQFAQVANGVLLPIIAIFLLWVVNRSSIMKDYTNSLMQNIIGAVIILITIGLSVKTLYTVFS